MEASYTHYINFLFLIPAQMYAVVFMPKDSPYSGELAHVKMCLDAYEAYSKAPQQWIWISDAKDAMCFDAASLSTTSLRDQGFAFELLPT